MQPLFWVRLPAHRRPPHRSGWQDLSAPTPTLPIILVSLVTGLGSCVVGFYLAYAILHLDVQWSAGLAALILAGAVSGTAALLSTLHDERTIGMNVGFSCVLTLLLLTFAGFCLIVGVFVATLVLLVQ